MLNQSGFGWDVEKKMIMVDSDEVYKEYVVFIILLFLCLLLMITRTYYIYYSCAESSKCKRL
jgi:hypothetical protein